VFSVHSAIASLSWLYKIHVFAMCVNTCTPQHIRLLPLKVNKIQNQQKVEKKKKTKNKKLQRQRLLQT